MNNKIKYGLIPVSYLVGIYISSFLLVFFNPVQQRKFGPCSAMFILYEFLGLGKKPFEIIYPIVWTSQFVAISVVALLLAKNLKLIEIDRMYVPYAISVSILYVIADMVAYLYLIEPLNNKIYGFRGRVMGSIGFIEDFVAEMVVSLPLFIIMSLILKMKYRSKASHAVGNLIVFIAMFILNRLTSDMWFPGI